MKYHIENSVGYNAEGGNSVSRFIGEFEAKTLTIAPENASLFRRIIKLVKAGIMSDDVHIQLERISSPGQSPFLFFTNVEDVAPGTLARNIGVIHLGEVFTTTRRRWAHSLNAPTIIGKRRDGKIWLEVRNNSVASAGQGPDYNNEVLKDTGIATIVFDEEGAVHAFDYRRNPKSLDDSKKEELGQIFSTITARIAFMYDQEKQELEELKSSTYPHKV